MKNKGVLTPDSRRSFIKQAGLTTAAAGALFGGFGMDPFIASAMAQEMGRSEQPLEGRLLERRAAGDLVRPGQAGGRVLGQAVQCRGHLVRR